MMEKVRIAAIGDLHAREHPEGVFRELFSELQQKADVVVLCGDLTQFGTPEEARNLARDLSVCMVPIVAVPGNHDMHNGTIAEVKSILKSARVIFVDDEPFEYKGIGFAGIKGFGGGFDSHILTPFGEELIKEFVDIAIKEALKLESQLSTVSTKRNVVVLHYSPISGTVHGESPEIFPFLGSTRFADVIDRFPVSAVFHGHAHHGIPKAETRSGIPVYNCAIDILRKVNPKKPYVLLEV